MVGKDGKIMMKPLAEIIGKYLGQPFKLGGRGDGGWGCIDLCYAIMKDLGKNPPDVVMGWKINCYEVQVGEDKELQHRGLLETTMNLGTHVERENLVPGDFVLVKTVKGGLLTSVYCGHGRVITSQLGIGVSILPLDHNNWILEARRFS